MLNTIELTEGETSIMVGTFIWGLEGPGVSATAAQDTLRHLGGIGLLPTLRDGSLDVVTFRERYAAQQEAS